MILTFLGIVAGVAAVTLYIMLVGKVGDIVLDRTANSGFDVGYYMVTVMTLLAIPVAGALVVAFGKAA